MTKVTSLRRTMKMNERIITNPEECQCLYCLGGSHKKKLMDLLDRVRLREGLTGLGCLKAKLTNYKEGTYYFHKRLHEDDNYPVSFDISIEVQEHDMPLLFKEASVMDENFLQPHPCGKQEYQQIEQCIRELINKKILVWKDGKEEADDEEPRH